MDDFDGFVQPLPQDRAEPEDVAGGQGVEAAVVGLRFDDGVEVAAVGDVHHQLAETRAVDAHLGEREIARDVRQAHALDEAAPALVVGDHEARGGVEAQPALLTRAHQALLEREGHRADRAVAAHRQAAAHLDVQDAGVAVRAAGRVEDRAGHDVVAARLEHQRGADPVVARPEILAARAHRGALQQRPAARHQAHRVAAGVAVDTEEGAERHGRQSARISITSQWAGREVANRGGPS